MCWFTKYVIALASFTSARVEQVQEKGALKACGRERRRWLADSKKKTTVIRPVMQSAEGCEESKRHGLLIRMGVSSGPILFHSCFHFIDGLLTFPRPTLRVFSMQSPKKVGEDIAKATGEWKGLRVTVKLTVQNRQAAVSVVPSASSLVIRALKGKFNILVGTSALRSRGCEGNGWGD